MEEEHPLASIIIVNFNGRNKLEKCLFSLSKTSYKNFEIIVVDNGSTDDSLQAVRQSSPECKIIQLTENKGFAIGNNIGARNANGIYLVFLNNDTVVTPDWLRELMAVMETDQSIVIAQSLLLTPEGQVDSSGDFATKYGRTYSSKKTGFKEPREILSARGAAVIVKRSYFETVGGFDEDYFISFEDVEVGWKAWLLGYRVVMVPNSIVYHEVGATTRKMSSMMTFHGLKNQLSLISTHFEAFIAIRNIMIVLGQLFIAFIRLKLGIGKYKQNFSVKTEDAVKAVFWYIKNIGAVRRKHKEINSKRKRSTKNLIQLGLITDDIDVN